jgi:flagellar protein FlgJ
MEIGNLGSLYLDDARFAASAMGIGKDALESGLTRSGASAGAGRPSFAELLEKSYGTSSPPPSSLLTPNFSPLLPPNSSLLPPNSSPLPPHSQKPAVDKTSRLYEQCEALETFLVKTLITGMRNTVQKSGLIDEGFAGKMYEDMLYDEYAKDFTKNAGFGLAELAYLELTGQRGRLLNSNPA